MADDAKIEPVEDANESDEEKTLLSRRNFLIGLRKWSTIIIGGALLSSVLPQQEASGWVNGRGGWVNGGGGGTAGWVNRAGGGGAGWVNRSGGGSAGWINGRGGWVNGAGWINR
jgi:hypothetical protein